MKQIVILGNGGHAKSIADSILSGNEYELVGFVSRDFKEETIYCGRGVIGCDGDLKKIFDRGIRCAAIGIGYMGKDAIREHLYGIVREIGFELPVIVDKTAIIGQETVIHEGTFVGKRAVINAGAVIGKMCIINTGAIIEHDSIVEEYTHVACGAVLCGGTKVGRKCLIGACATVIENIDVPTGIVIPAGEAVTRRNRPWHM